MKFRLHKIRDTLLLTGSLILLSLNQAAHANVVLNPFFTGTAAAATSWTSSAPTYVTYNHALSPGAPAAVSGSGSTELYSGCVGAACLTFPLSVGTSGGASQTITTTIGTAYSVSFWIYNSGQGTAAAPQETQVYWGNTLVYDGLNLPAGWLYETVDLGVASASSYALTVLLRDDPNYSAITMVDVEASTALLRLQKTNPAVFVAGTAANYNLTITNYGSSASSASFTLQDQLPPNIQYNSAAAGTGITSLSGCGTTGTLAAGLLVTCTVNVTGGIPAGGTGSLTINVTPQAAATGVSTTNKASVPPSGTGAGVAPSTCTANDSPAGCAVAAAITAPHNTNLSLSKTNPANFAVGVAANYSFTITNSGTNASSASFTLQDQLPPNIRYNSAAVGAGITGVVCSASGTLAAGQLVTCSITTAAGIAASGTGSLTINVTPQAGASGVSGTNSASVPPSGAGAGVSPSSCTATGTPAGCAVAAPMSPALLSLAKSNPATFVVGTAANYSLTITNSGSASSTASFTLQDQLPPNIQYNSAAAGTGITSLSGCGTTGTLAAGLLVTCTVNVTGGILGGGTGTLTINVTPQAASAGVAGINKASVPPYGTGSGVAPSICTATGTPAGCAVAAAITPGTSLSLAKSNPAIFAVNVPANYSLTITNSGSIASAASFTLQDQLPPNIQYNSAAAGTSITSLSGCGTTGTLAAGLLVTCTVNVTGGILGGGTGTLTINATPQPASAGVSGTNKASVPPTGTGAGVAPSTCTATGTPAGCAVAGAITPTSVSLAVSKTATLICDPVNGTVNPKYIPGAIVRWTITTINAGTTPVSLTTASDILSAYTTMDSNLITGAGGVAGCNSAAGTPEFGAGYGFKLSITGSSRPAANYPKFFTTAVDADAASSSAGTVSINYGLGLPAEGAYTTGQLNPGETVVVYFNVSVN